MQHEFKFLDQLPPIFLYSVPGKLLENDYIIYHYKVKRCQNCTLNCQAPKKKNRAIGVIARLTHFDLFQQFEVAMQTALFKQKLVERLA
ncbi:hypothetical protein [Legionella gresilensis]|uniref:hypothetical protein n=1 Tax=Legionella gresilensis TaxID=91823 RepID=UPI001040F6E2|nr:hypothetical protein [Legionella gresilensis]